MDCRDEKLLFGLPGLELLWPVPWFAPVAAAQSWLAVNRDSRRVELLLSSHPDEAFTLGRVRSGMGLARAHGRDAGWCTLQPDEDQLERVWTARFVAPTGPPLVRLLTAGAREGGKVPPALLLIVVRRVHEVLERTGRPVMAFPRPSQIIVGWDGSVTLLTDVSMLARFEVGLLPDEVARRMRVFPASAQWSDDGDTLARQRVQTIVGVMARLGLMEMNAFVVRSDQLAEELMRLEGVHGVAAEADLGGLARTLLPETWAREERLRDALELDTALDLDALRQSKPPDEELTDDERRLLAERARFFADAEEPHPSVLADEVSRRTERV